MSHRHTFQYIPFIALECQVGRCSVQLPGWFIGNRGSCQWGLLHIRSIKPWLGRDSTPTWVKPQWKEKGGALWVVGELRSFAGTQLAVLQCFYVGFIRGLGWIKHLSDYVSQQFSPQPFMWTSTFSVILSQLLLICFKCQPGPWLEAQIHSPSRDCVHG